MTIYIQTAILRVTKSGKRWLAYRFVESFGRDTGYARSWGCREARGTGLVWAMPEESIDDAIARRNAELY